MTLFTDNPFEKMMIQKPDYGKREKSPPELSVRGFFIAMNFKADCA